MPPDVGRDDHVLASDLAGAAGRLLVEIRDRLVADGASAAELKTAGDEAAHRFLVDALESARPQDAVLSEEGIHLESDQAKAERLGADRVWIVDPLDGTREFSEPPRDDWAVHVALAVEGEPVCGAVALPAHGKVLSTADPPAVPPRDGPPRIVVSRSRPPREASTIRDTLGGRLVEMGSAGAKAMAVVDGSVDIYPHSGGQYEWDSCAPVAVARAAGLWCSRLDGSDLVYNRDDPYLPDLLICRPEDAPAVLESLGRR